SLTAMGTNQLTAGVVNSATNEAVSLGTVTVPGSNKIGPKVEFFQTYAPFLQGQSGTCVPLASVVVMLPQLSSPPNSENATFLGADLNSDMGFDSCSQTFGSPNYQSSFTGESIMLRSGYLTQTQNQ